MWNKNIVIYCLLLTHLDEEGFGYEGYGSVSEFSIKKVYHNEYMSQIRHDLKEATRHYECNHMLNIPMCMMKGSLNIVLVMAAGNEKTYKLSSPVEGLWHSRKSETWGKQVSFYGISKVYYWGSCSQM